MRLRAVSFDRSKRIAIHGRSDLVAAALEIVKSVDVAADDR